MKPTKDLMYLSEPTLLFRHGQAMEDPRDGLSFLGPYDDAQNYGVKYGVIGTVDGIRRFKSWVSKIQGPVSEAGMGRKRPPFPGFQAAFGIPWSPQPLVELVYKIEHLEKCVLLNDPHKRNFETVRFFTDLILQAIRNEEVKPEVWIIVIPNFVRQFCRPESVVLTKPS